MRAQSDAILTGIGTVLSTIRCYLPPAGDGKALAGTRRARSIAPLPLTSRLAQTARETLVWVVASADAAFWAGDALRDLGVDVLRVEGAGRPHLAATLKLLAARGITRLMVETGPILAAAFVAADLVDEAVLFRAPGARQMPSMRWKQCRSPP